MGGGGYKPLEMSLDQSALLTECTRPNMCLDMYRCIEVYVGIYVCDLESLIYCVIHVII